MHWSLYVLIGAVINTAVNAGYKIIPVKESILFIAASVMAVSSLALFGYALAVKTGRVADVVSGSTPLVIAGMGIGSAIVAVFFVTALTKGPLSLVDPLWACIYALASVLIGLYFIREAPSITSLVGVGLYIVGAFLMSRG